MRKCVFSFSLRGYSQKDFPGSLTAEMVLILTGGTWSIEVPE